jgi:hypothetical protein
MPAFWNLCSSEHLSALLSAMVSSPIACKLTQGNGQTLLGDRLCLQVKSDHACMYATAIDSLSLMNKTGLR